MLVSLLPIISLQAASLNLTGHGDGQDAGGNFSFAIRTNESVGSLALSLGSDTLRFQFDWDQNWLWLGFRLPDGSLVEDYLVSRTVPFRTSPSSGYTWGTWGLSSGDFDATFDFRSDDYLVTGNGTWTLGNGAPPITVASPPILAAIQSVPDSGSPALMMGLILAAISIYRKFSVSFQT